MFTCPSSQEFNLQPKFKPLLVALIIAISFYWAVSAKADTRFTKYKLSSTISNTVTGTTATDFTNGSVTIKTTGRPVMVSLTSASTDTTAALIGGYVRCNAPTTTNGFCRIIFLRDSSVIASTTVGVGDSVTSNNAVYAPCSAFSYLDFPSAGTKTYKVQGNANAGSDVTTNIKDCKLQVYELP